MLLLQLALATLAAGGVTVLATVFAGRAKARALARRVGMIGGAQPGATGRAAPAPPGLFAAGGEHLRALFTFHMARRWGVSAKAPFLVVAGLVAAAAVWGLVGYLLHFPVYLRVLMIVGGFFLLPRLIVRRQQHRADAHFAELLPDAIDMVVRMVRAGIAIAAAIRVVGEEAAVPVSTVFVQTADLTEIGMPLEEALTKIGDTVGSADFRFFAVTIALQRATGGNLAVSLETLSEIIRKRRTVRLKAKSATAEIRMSAITLAAIPFFVVGALLFTSPGYLTPLITDPRGNIIAGAAILSLCLGGLSMRWMIRSGTKT